MKGIGEGFSYLGLGLGLAAVILALGKCSQLMAGG